MDRPAAAEPLPGGPQARRRRRAPARPATVAANGAEGEPASDKDKTLLREVRPLVLDGRRVVPAGAVNPRALLVRRVPGP